MSREKAIDARCIGATVKIEVCQKVETKYRKRASDSLSTIYARALEDSVRDVELTDEDYKVIVAEIEANRRKREMKRLKEKGE